MLLRWYPLRRPCTLPPLRSLLERPVHSVGIATLAPVTPAALVVAAATTGTAATIVSAVPFATRTPLRLHELTDVLPERRKKRVGRGIGSGKGKTAGYGKMHRQGSPLPYIGFAGGQTPMHLGIPKRGFNNKQFAEEYVPVNLSALQEWIDAKRLPTDEVITIRTLHEAGLANNIKDGVKLLARDADFFQSKINIEVSKASRKAIERVHELGGTVKEVYYTRLGLRALMKPESFAPGRLPKFASPTKSKHIEYYRRAAEEYQKRLEDLQRGTPSPAGRPS